MIEITQQLALPSGETKNRLVTAESSKEVREWLAIAPLEEFSVFQHVPRYLASGHILARIFVFPKYEFLRIKNARYPKW
mgnify:CR=1 FL=1|tara:strand:- start:378 stop:614 length:237 start_codon:yes stop_codon:yes gene_type:complete